MVATVEHFQTTGEGRVFQRLATGAIIHEGPTVPGFFQRGQLQSRILGVGRDAGIAVCYAHNETDL